MSNNYFLTYVNPQTKSENGTQDANTSRDQEACAYLPDRGMGTEK